MRLRRSGDAPPAWRRCPRLAGSRHGSWYIELELPAGPAAGAAGSAAAATRPGGRGSGAGRAAQSRPGDQGGRVLTVGDWLERWLASRTSPAASTIRGYAAHVRLYLAPYLGRVLLAELSTAHVQAMFTAITRQHQAAGSPVTSATLTRIRATLRAALNAAIRRGLITDNPASRAELPPRPPAACGGVDARPSRALAAHRGTARRGGVDRGADRAVPARNPGSPAVCRLPPDRAARACAAARLPGCAGATWTWTARRAVISQQLQQYDGHLVVCPPKTPHSARVIALDHTTVAALRAHRDRQHAEAAAFGPGYRASGYVFTNLNGDPMAPDRLSRTSEARPPKPGCRRSGCTTCGTARPRSRWPPGVDLRRSCRTCSATPASC